MNPYGDPNAARGRAQVPGGPGYEDYDYASPPVSSSRVPLDGPVSGRASVGRASVASGGYQYDDEPSGERTIGRASVPGLGGGGAGATGRASVPGLRPISPGPGGPGGPGVPPGMAVVGGGPTGPGRRSKAPRSKKRKRLNWIIASVAVFIMLAGGVVIGGTYYYDTIPPVEALDLPESTTIFYADGQNQIAKLGEANRILVPLSQVPAEVQHAVVAAEDKNFYEHDGVDPVGIARAAWKNVTGDSIQGASTITQQYARHVANLTDISYARKVREAMLATKLESEYSKDQILGFYINTIYFGRGAHGIEAAAQTFFGHGVAKLTVEEAAVLAAIIRQPEPQQGGHQGYDPQINPTDAKDRWNYVLNNMVEKGWLDKAKRDAMEYPKPYDAKNPKAGGILPINEKSCASTNECGVNTPAGNVVNYVAAELKAMGIDDWKHGGYRITTSINKVAQDAAIHAAQRAFKGSVLSDQPKNLMAALAAIDPKTGRVIAYYGGDSGVGFDYAGTNFSGDTLKGGHPPGSSFKIYTLLAALRQNFSIDSYWDAIKYTDGPVKLSNAGRNPPCKQWCSLEYSTVQSYNVPFYWITKAIGPDKVIEAARDAGVRMMWTNEDELIDLTKVDPKSVAPSKFSTQVGFGQYAVTVLDHASGLATIANRGIANKTHFVVKVERKNPETGKWAVLGGDAAEKIVPVQKFEANKVDDIVSVLRQIPAANGDSLKDGRVAGSKTGTWELDQKHSSDNGDAWTIGFTPQIATAVWVGNVDKREKLVDKNGAKVGGGSLPGTIWKRFMDEAHANLKLPKLNFPDRKGTGDPDISAQLPGAGVSPTPAAPDQGCVIPLLCPSQDPSRGPGGGGPGGGGDPGGGGGGPGLPPSRPPRG